MIQQMESNEKKFKKSSGCQGDVETHFLKGLKARLALLHASDSRFLPDTPACRFLCALAQVR